MTLRDHISDIVDEILPEDCSDAVVRELSFELDRFVRNFTAVAVTDVHSMLKYEDMSHDDAVDCAIEAAEETL